MRFSPEVLAAFKDKDSKKEDCRALYEEHDYITAYSKHTDLRIVRDGKELAIGAKRDGMQDWEIHGQMQLGLLRSHGLTPDSTLLDFGCGTGRLACVAVPFLAPDRYTGVDISASAITACKALAFPEKRPVFILGNGTLDAVAEQSFDMVWAHSVFTHLPPDIIATILAQLSKMDFGQFLYTYKRGETEQRTGLKQFCYTPAWFRRCAKRLGMAAEEIDLTLPGGQKVMRIRRVP